MALLDLDKIIINRTIAGINCNNCGGTLKLIEKKSNTVKIINMLTLGKVKSKNYECELCKKQFILI